MFKPNSDGKPTLDFDKLKKYDDKIKECRDMVEGIKEEVIFKTRELKESIFPKADQAALEAVESKLFELLNIKVQEIYKVFANK